MNLKESFRYQNYLQGLFNELRSILSYNTGVMYETHTLHNIQSVYKNGKSFEEVKRELAPPLSSEQNVTAGVIMDIMRDVIEEKYLLSNAINKAKARLVLDDELDIDASLIKNTLTRDCAMTVKKTIKNTKARLGTSESTGTAQGFNNEGNPVSFQYPIIVKNVQLFDCDEALNITKRILDNTDKASQLIESATINIDIGFDNPKFNVNDEISSVIDRYLDENN